MESCELFFCIFFRLMYAENMYFDLCPVYINISPSFWHIHPIHVGELVMIVAGRSWPEIGSHLPPLLTQDLSGSSYHYYGPKCPVTYSTGFSPWVSCCLGTIVNGGGGQGRVGCHWIEQTLVCSMTLDTSFYATHNCPQAAQNTWGNNRKRLILMAPLGQSLSFCWDTASWPKIGSKFSATPRTNFGIESFRTLKLKP